MEINTFEDICRAKNEDPGKFNLPINSSLEAISDNAYNKLKLIVSVLNDGWFPNWEDSSQQKHYPYFKKVSGKFICYDYGCYSLFPVAGSRLVYKSRYLAEFVVYKFGDIYNEYLNYV